MYTSQANNPLYKGFTCLYCEKTFRNRAGLSGHIQFKHSTKQNILDIATNDIELLKDKLHVAVSIIGLDKTTTQMIEIILNNWIKITIVCEQLDIDLNKQDFKNYFVAGLAGMYQS